jgi:dodecin
MAVLKILELVGTSRQSWSDAAREAVNEAAKSVRGIETVEVVHSKAVVENNQLSEYQVLVRIGFRVESSASGSRTTARSAGSQNSGSKKKS